METNNFTSFIMIPSIIIVMFCLLTGSQADPNYCDAQLCGRNVKHIGCKNDGRFVRKCPPGAKLLDINIAMQKTLVDDHNALRQQWASGKGKLKINACRMATIRWSAELARLAELNVKQCAMKHDGCHNTKQFKFTGQNLYTSSVWGKDAPDKNTVLRSAVQSWASEGDNVKLQHLLAYPGTYDGPAIGHFTVMAHERNVAVGCAISNYKEKTNNIFLVACNYAVNNMIDWPVIASCKKSAEKCKAGTNPKYSALCATSEDVDYNFNKK